MGWQWNKAASQADLDALAVGEAAGRLTEPTPARQSTKTTSTAPDDFDDRDNAPERRK